MFESLVSSSQFALDLNQNKFLHLLSHDSHVNPFSDMNQHSDGHHPDQRTTMTANRPTVVTVQPMVQHQQVDDKRQQDQHHRHDHHQQQPTSTVNNSTRLSENSRRRQKSFVTSLPTNSRSRPSKNKSSCNNNNYKNKSLRNQSLLENKFFETGCLINKHAGKVLFVGILVLITLSVALKSATIETNVEKLWVEGEYYAYIHTYIHVCLKRSLGFVTNS